MDAGRRVAGSARAPFVPSWPNRKPVYIISGHHMNSTDQAAQNQIAAWLLLCCAMVFAMVVVGGVTRLTHSGLSIVEWQPLVGTLPPLNEAQWLEVFHKYQQTPEYQKVNFDMGLDEFKGIFWWEYFHRLLGRSIGAVFLLPFLYFLLRKKIEWSLAPRLAGIFILGGLQGALGWYMVASGLVDDPRVSQYRLTAHLGMAFVIYAAMLWVALGLLSPTSSRPEGARALGRFSLGLRGLIFLMVLSGGFVAGIRAGLAYNTFPLMNGHWICGDARLVGLPPCRGTHAPAITRLQAGKVVGGHRRDEIVTLPAREGEEFGGHLHADDVQPDVLGAGVAAAVAIEAGARPVRARDERAAEHV